MPGFELIDNEEKNALINIFDKDKNNGVLFDHAFHELRNGHYEVKEFEKELAKKLNVKYAVCCTSGTSALKIALKSVGVKCRDEVITQAFNFIAGPEAIYDCGSIVKLTNIDETLNMDPLDLEKKITSNTKAIMVVHMLGISAKMNEIIKIGKKHNIPIIEDAAEAMGGKYNNKYLGTIGDIGCYSLDYAKTITTGEGGVIVTNNDEYYKYMIEYIDHGHENNPSVPRGLDTVSIPGFNYRITEMQGAIGKVQLKKLDFIVNENTKRYKILEKKLGFLKIRTNIAKNDDTLHDTFMFMVREKELNKLILDYCIKNIGIKNVPTAFNWHFCSFWNHIIPKEEIDYINPSFNIIKEYIAIPILLKKTEEDYLKIADDIIQIYNVYYKNIYKETGVIHVKDFFTDYEYLENINDNIYRYINEHKNSLDKYDYNINSNGLVTDAHCLHKHDDYFFLKLIKNKKILNLCEKLIGSKVEVFGCEIFFKRPGKNNVHSVPWHQDNSMWCLDDHNALTVWIAITDVNKENGSVRHIPNSYKYGLLEHEFSGQIGTSQKLTEENINKYCSVNDFVQFIMNQGDITIHHSLSIHDSLPNNSENNNRFAITLKIKSCVSKIDNERFDKYKNTLLKHHG
jgi:8-amino-3,8-dideoxy-alpha-D-manno-octulosonate transaminase